MIRSHESNFNVFRQLQHVGVVFCLKLAFRVDCWRIRAHPSAWAELKKDIFTVWKISSLMLAQSLTMFGVVCRLHSSLLVSMFCSRNVRHSFGCERVMSCNKENGKSGSPIFDKLKFTSNPMHENESQGKVLGNRRFPNEVCSIHLEPSKIDRNSCTNFDMKIR